MFDNGSHFSIIIVSINFYYKFSLVLQATSFRWRKKDLWHVHVTGYTKAFVFPIGQVQVCLKKGFLVERIVRNRPV